MTTVTTGAVLVDSSNTYPGEPYRISLLDAHCSAAFDSEAEQIVELGAALTKKEEIYEQLSETLVTIKTSIFDYLKNTNVFSASKTVAGSTAQRSVPQSKRIIVGLTDDSTPTRIEPLSTGELPTAEAIALARRKLEKLSLGFRSATADVIGVDASLKRGSEIRLTDRSGASFGSFRVTGFEISGDSESGISQQLSVEEI